MRLLGYEIMKGSEVSEMKKEFADIQKKIKDSKFLRPDAESQRRTSADSDGARVPTYPIAEHQLYSLGKASDIVMTVIGAISDGIFRRGTEILAQENVLDIDETQKFMLQRLLKIANKNGQSLLEVLEEVEEDVNLLNNGYLIAIKDYLFGGDGRILPEFTEVVEFVRGSPIKIRIISDSQGRRSYTDDGERILVSVANRSKTFSEKQAKDLGFIDPSTGKEIRPAHYRGERDYGNDKYIYYIDGEVLHLSKGSNLIYGYPKMMAVWLKVATLIEQDRYLLLAYQKGRPPRGVFTINTANVPSVIKAWEHMKAETRKDPHAINPLTLDENAKVQWTDLLRPPAEMEFTVGRNEMRRQIGANWGVLPIFSADVSQAGGMNNESLMPDIPVMIKRNGWIDFTPISSLHSNGDHKVSEFGLKNLKVMTRSGWSPIKRVFRHRCKDRGIHEINTTMGYTEVTEDHSLFKENGEELLGKEVKVGEKLEIKKAESEDYCHGINKEFAYTLGLFAADGSSDKNQGGSRVTIYNTNKKLLEKAKFGADGFFVDDFKICNYKNTNGNDISKLNMDKNKVMAWIDEYCYATYSERINWEDDGIKKFRTKKVPPQILNGDCEVKQAYLQGYMDGDGHIDKKERESFSTISKTLCAGLQLLYNARGQKIKIEWRENGKNNILRARLVKTDFKTKENEVTKINSKRYTGNVYDLETEDHTFVAGIGYLLHHNSQQIVVTNRAVQRGQKLYNNKVFPWISKVLNITNYQIQLLEPEERDETEDAKRLGIKIDNAVKMSNIGFDVTFNRKEEDFNYSEKPINEPSGQFFPGLSPQGRPQLGGMPTKVSKFFNLEDEKNKQDLVDGVKNAYNVIKGEMAKKENLSFDIKKAEIDDFIKFISAALFDKTFEGVTKAVSSKIKKIILDSIVDKSTVSATMKKIQKLGVDKEQAELITRTEQAVLQNHVREFNFEKAEGSEDFKYFWLGPNDSRTADVSKEIKKKSAKGLKLEKLKKLVRKTSQEFGFKPDRDWFSHPNQRHTFVRVV